MMFFARAVVTGFALALGNAVFKKLAPKIGLGEDKDEDEDEDDEPDVAQQEASTDPQLS